MRKDIKTYESIDCCRV